MINFLDSNLLFSHRLGATKIRLPIIYWVSGKKLREGGLFFDVVCRKGTKVNSKSSLPCDGMELVFYSQLPNQLTYFRR